jgi:exosortase
MAIAFAWAYWPTLAKLVGEWNHVDDYSHGFFVAPLAGYFLWVRRDSFPGLSVRVAWPGLALITVSILARALGAWAYVEAVDGLTILLWLAGVVWLFGGWSLLRWSSSSIAFLFFMIPLPWSVERLLRLPLQNVAAGMSAWVLQFFGQPALREGTTILLGDFSLEVEEACSGLRIFVGIVALAVACVIVTRRPRWEKLLLLASALPVALISNSTRIVVTGLLHQWVSGEAANKFTHDVAGWVMIPFAAGLLALVYWFLSRLAREVEVVEPASVLRQADRRSPSRTKATVLNVRLLVGTLIAVVLVTPAAAFWHSRQVRRTATVYIDRADNFERQEDWATAAKHLFLYLRLHPDSADVKVRLAETYDKSADTAEAKLRAIELYRQALKVAADDARPSLRHSLMELLLQLGQFSDLETEAKTCLGENENDPQAKRHLALARYGQFRSGARPGMRADAPSVAQAFKDALELNPQDVQLAAILARIYRDHDGLLDDDQRKLGKGEREKQADAIIDQMIRENPASAEAFLARYEYRTTYELPEAGEDLKEALELGPDDLAVLLSAADYKYREAARIRANKDSAEDPGQYLKEAREHYEHITQNVDPSCEGAYQGLGGVLWAQGEVDQAINAWEAGLEKSNPDSFPLLLRLADAFIAQNPPEEDEKRLKDRLEDGEKYLAKLDNAVLTFGPRLTRSGRASLEASIATIKANLHLKRGDHEEGIRLLEQATSSRRGSGSEDSQSLRSLLMLGDAYAASRNWNKAAAAYEQAVRIDPNQVQSRLALARAWAAAGRPEMAVRHYEQALAQEDVPETWLLLASASLQQQVGLPPGNRNWETFDNALDRAKKADKESLTNGWRLPLIEANQIVVRGEEQGKRDRAVQDATKLLRQAEEEYSESADFFRALGPAYEELGAASDADRALGRFDELSDDRLPVYLMRIGLLSSRTQYDEAEQIIRKGLDEELPDEARAALRRALVQLRLQQDQVEEARQELERLHNDDPANITYVLQLAELALASEDYAKAERWENELQKEELEGTDGAYWRYFKARRLVAQADASPDDPFAEATRLQEEIRRQRPNWPPAYVLSGLIFERRGNPSQAIDAYESAVRLGERGVAVYERLITLLYQARSYPKADQYLLQLEDQIADSETLSSLEISLAASQRQFSRALAGARRAVDRKPDDPMAWLNLGQLQLSAAEQVREADPSLQQQARESLRKEAETSLRKAVELGPGDVRATNGLLAYYLRTGQTDGAGEVLEGLAANSELSDLQRAVILAQGYALLGDREKAEPNFRKAFELAPDDVDLQMQVGTFLVSTDAEEAEKRFNRVLEIDRTRGDARRQLAQLRATRGGEKGWKEAQGLLLSESSPDEKHLNQRLLAALLARRGNRKDAMQLLEELVKDPRVSTDTDLLLLARLYVDEGRSCQDENERTSALRTARRHFITLAARADAKPEHVLTYVDYLLDSNSFDEAAPWVDKLEELSAGNANGMLTWLNVKARWLKSQGRISEIEPLIQKLGAQLLDMLGENDEQKVALWLGLGNVLSTVELHKEAEGFYRRLTKLSPDRFGALAISLAKQGKMKEAIQLCLDAAETDDSAQSATVLTAVLMSGKPTEADFKLAEPLLTKAAEDHPDNPNLLVSLASVRIVQERTQDAVSLYEKVLKQNSSHLVALNNLASLLAEQPGKTEEAIKHIDRAIDLAGRQPALLDTKAMALVHGGKPKEAVPLLEEAASSPNPDPRFYFHLAVAYHRTQQPEKAADALRKADQGDLQGTVLTEKDRQLLRELEEALRS